MSVTVTYETIRDILPGARTYQNYTAGLCPFHDDSKPSLLVFEDGFFKCLGCGVVGNFDKLYRKLRGISASRVVSVEEEFRPPRLPTDLRDMEELAEGAHYAITRFEQLRWYLENRGVEGRIEPCRLGWYKGWYTIPIYDSKDTFMGLVLRAGAEIQKVTGLRFVQPRGQKPMMYCPDWNAYKNSNALAVVFGMFDALAVSDLGFAVVTPIGGQDNFNHLWLEDYRKKIYIIPDMDEELSATKLAGKLGWRGNVLKLPYPDSVKDPAGYFETGRRAQLEKALAGPLS